MGFLRKVGKKIKKGARISLIKNNSLKEEMQIQLKELAKPDAAIVIVNEMMALL